MSLRLRGVVDLDRFTLDVDIEAADGEVLAILGPNGCGKSTALQAVAGLRSLTAGSLRLGDDILDDPAVGTWVPAHRRRIGMVFQHLHLFPHLSVLDNVAYGIRRSGVDRRGARTVAADWLVKLGLDHLRSARPPTLSGGQAQRVALARALAVGPRVLLLDEPMSALDAESRLAIRGELRRRLDVFDGITLLVTHDLIDVVGLADRVVVLDEGRVIQDATPDELRRHPLSSHSATLVGRNVIRCQRHDGRLVVGDVVLGEAPGPAGVVDVVCSPAAVRLVPRHAPRPVGSWPATVIGIEAMGDHARAYLGQPVPAVARLALDALEDGLSTDAEVWAHLDLAQADVFASTDSP